MPKKTKNLLNINDRYIPHLGKEMRDFSNLRFVDI